MTMVWYGPRMDCYGWLGVHRVDLLLVQNPRLIVKGQTRTDDGLDMWVGQKVERSKASPACLVMPSIEYFQIAIEKSICRLPARRRFTRLPPDSTYSTKIHRVQDTTCPTAQFNLVAEY